MFFHSQGIHNNGASRLCAHASGHEVLTAVIYKHTYLLLAPYTHLNKRFTTSCMLTDKRPFACMYPHMSCEIAPARECFTTALSVAGVQNRNTFLLFYLLYLSGRRKWLSEEERFTRC